MTERQVYLAHIRRLQAENDALRRGLAAEYVRRVGLHKQLIEKEAEHQKWRRSRIGDAIDSLLYVYSFLYRERNAK